MALKPLNSVGGFSVGEIPANVILANADITANNATFSGNVSISNATASWGVLTDNLYYSNGQPWDFQQAAGANFEIQFNMGDDFAASPNLTFNNTTQLLTVTGNANITGTLTAGALEVDEIFNGNSNVAIPVANSNVNISVAGNANVLVVTGTGANVAGYFTATSTITGSNLALTDGNIVSTGSSGLYLTPANSTAGIVVQANTAPNANNSFNLGSSSKVFANIYGNNVIVSANLDSGNANLGNLAVANYVNVNNDLNVVAGIFTGNIQVNVSANFSNVQVANFVVSNLTPSTDDQYYLGTTSKRWKDINIAGNANLGLVNATGNGSFANVEFGNLLTGNYALFDNDVQVTGNIANANNINATNYVYANNANITANLTSGNANLGNLAQANFVNVSQNLNVTGNIAGTYANLVGNLHIAPSGANNFGILTDYLYYANGVAWDLQEAAGSNNEIQFNLNDNFAASANFTYDDTTQVFKVTGNANITNTLLTPNVNSGAGNLTLTANGFNTVLDNTGNATFPGNVTAHTFYGNVNANVSITAANTTVLFSDSGLIDGTTGFTFDKLSNLVTMTGNVNLGPAGVNQLVNLSNTALEIRGGWDSNAGAVNIVAGDYDNNATWGKLAILGNVGGNAVGYSEANAFVFTTPDAGAGNVVRVDTLNTAAANTTSGALQVAGGLGVTGNGYFGNLSVTGDIANANNISITNNVNAVIGNFSGNINSLNANLGNLVQANYVNVASNVTSNNVSVNLELSGNTANFSGNVILPNLSVNSHVAGNTANFIGNVTLSGSNVIVNNNIDGNTANFTGNISSLNAVLGNLADANFIRTGELLNGNSNIVIVPNGNVVLSSAGTANVLTVSNLGANIIGYVTANGDGSFGEVKSNTVTAQGGNLELRSEQTGNSYIRLRPFGDGTVDVGNTRITSLATPNAASDAATKQYVDDVAQGLNVHDSVYTATGNTLAVLTGGTITYNNGTAGVGANLVLTGSPTKQFTSANCFDGNVTASIGSRILVKNEANAAHNGIYDVTSATVLTRSSDYDTVPEVEAGDFVFVQDGDTYNDTGWVQTSVVVTIGTDPINFTQFSGAGTYQAGAGLTLTGTVFSVNVDNVTTEINGGNVIVKANAQLTTPDIGAATGTSLNLTGNVLAGNVNSNALITAANINVTSNVLSNNFNANSNVTANGLTVNLAIGGNTANFSGNVILPNLTVNLELAGNTANFTNNVVANGLTINNAIGGNTANFSGNVILPNLTVNLELAGNTANFTGNINSALNANLGNLVTANYVNVAANIISNNMSVNLELAGNTANFTGNLTAANLVTAGVANVANLNVTANVTSNLLPNANLTLDLGSSTQRWQDVFAGNIDASGNLTIAGNLQSNNYTANIITANVQVNVGNTSIRHAEVVTTSTNANQTLSTVTASGITGVEWIVKGIDSAGSGKYSMAIVSAVTDGTSVDYATFGGVTLGSTTGSLAVNIVGGNIALQVTPSSSNSTTWVTQYRTI